MCRFYGIYAIGWNLFVKSVFLAIRQWHYITIFKGINFNYSFNQLNTYHIRLTNISLIFVLKGAVFKKRAVTLRIVFFSIVRLFYASDLVNYSLLPYHSNTCLSKLIIVGWYICLRDFQCPCFQHLPLDI